MSGCLSRERNHSADLQALHPDCCKLGLVREFRVAIGKLTVRDAKFYSPSFYSIAASSKEQAYHDGLWPLK